MCDPLARVAELEAEREELLARIEASERDQATVATLQDENAMLQRRFDEATRERAALQARRELVQSGTPMAAWKFSALALAGGIIAGFLHTLFRFHH